MRRWWSLLAVGVAATFTGVGSATTVSAPPPPWIPYLSGGAGVYIDENGRPVTSEGAPRVPGIHLRPPLTEPVPGPTPQPTPQPVPTPEPVPPRAPEPEPPVVPAPITPIPAPTPIPIPTPPPPDGYNRPDLVAAVALQQVKTVFCRTDAAWPSAPWSSLARRATGSGAAPRSR